MSHGCAAASVDASEGVYEPWLCIRISFDASEGVYEWQLWNLGVLHLPPTIHHLLNLRASLLTSFTCCQGQVTRGPPPGQVTRGPPPGSGH